MAWPEDYINKIVRGDSLEALKSMPEKSVDLIATDPPYGLGFAGEKWDQDLPSEDIWRECFRVLKPGAFAFVITTPRQDCLAELISRMGRAGFDVQFPSIYWAYLSGFPKSLDIGLAIDQKLGAERPVAGEVAQPGGQMRELSRGGRGREKGTAWTGIRYDDKPITPQAEAFAGWRSPGLKPAVEVIVVAVRPMSEKDYASQAIKSLEDGSEGSGCFNIGACRIPYRSREEFEAIHDGACRFRSGTRGFFGHGEKGKGEWRPVDPAGRYPANMLVSDNALDDGVQRKAGGSRSPGRAGRGAFLAGKEHQSFGDEGSAGRLFDLDLWWEKMVEALPDRIKRTFPFLLEPKPSSAERDSGCEGLYWERDGTEFGYKLVGKERWEELGREEERISAETEAPCSLRARGNIHITVKPVNLFCYLITLASRDGQVVLDPFAGSGTTGVAAKILNRRYLLVDMHEGNCEIARRRIRDAGLPLFDAREDAP